MADEIIPYLKFNPKLGTYPTIKVQPFPFPPHLMPNVFNLRTFFIEKTKRGDFLRSTENSLFCSAIYAATDEIEVPDWDDVNGSYKYDGVGEILFKTETLTYWYFCMEGEDRVVAYKYSGTAKTFLHVDASDEAFESLDEKLQKLYLGAKLMTKEFMDYYESEIKKLDSKKSNFKPKGVWEAEMFRDVFNSDPRTMTDDEFEMIFGIER